MLNTVTIQGRFTHDPEVRQTPNGKSVTSFSIACERDVKDQNTGERATDFFSCVAWNGLADTVGRYFRKGRMAIVTGRLETRKYTDKNGNDRTVTEIKAASVYFADSAKDNAQQQSQPAQQYNAPVRAYVTPEPSYSAPSYRDYPDYGFSQVNSDDGDLPF